MPPLDGKRSAAVQLAIAATVGSAATLAAVFIAGRLRRKRCGSARAKALLGPLAARRGEYAEELQVATELALQCGEAMRQCLETKRETDWKDEAAIDPVTATDQANERLVTEGLKARFPSHEVIGEEAAAAAGRTPPLTAAPTWIVDPIDGTTNFVYGMKLSVVSIGLCVGGVPTVGVIYDPYADELFAAVRGQGAYLNGRPIAVDGVQCLSQAMVQFEFGYVRSPDGMGRMFGALQALMSTGGARAVRTLGSCVLSMAWVACGRSSLYYTGVDKEGGKPWDYAAGAIVATEAGAHLSDIRGGAFSVEGKSVVCAATPQLAAELCNVVSDFVVAGN